ncbi:hypothetical protein ASPBRDRAFT_49713 [Aspergillus brasiliensis CBS 101740]|uniref:RNase III domain-containing protein n=1 Tax=Aspergillus brasiliensis (strain CBS 101740 / IMI 381727 / IBT 21946) TaxID=767769 RepID=A0A1L9U1L9_ASPBC|nr:hypothetical protein ASPBRDRAFT_49713 [Aspergillus brasiliensis CBS 101740]
MQSPRDFIEGAIAYNFKNKCIIDEAIQQTRNKRLAFLGDKVVALVIVDSWYRSKRSCGDGYKQLQNYASNRKLACQARGKHIDECIQPGPLNPLSSNPSIHSLATDVEAIVGAVWIDSGRNFGVVKGVMRRLELCPA